MCCWCVGGFKWPIKLNWCALCVNRHNICLNGETQLSLLQMTNAASYIINIWLIKYVWFPPFLPHLQLIIIVILHMHTSLFLSEISAQMQLSEVIEVREETVEGSTDWRPYICTSVRRSMHSADHQAFKKDGTVIVCFVFKLSLKQTCRNR